MEETTAQILRIDDRRGVAEFYERNISFDVLHFDFDNENEVSQLDWGTDQSQADEVKNRLKTHQRLLRLIPDKDHAKKLLDCGYGSAHDIADLSEQELVRRLQNEIDERTVRTIYRQAIDIKERTSLLAGNLRDVVASPHYRNSRFCNLHSDLVTFAEANSPYELKSTNPNNSHLSAFSPTAYFITLRKLIDEKITQPSDESLKLNKRRPDLFSEKMPWNRLHSETEIPYLQIVNEVVEARLLQLDGISNVYRHLATQSVYPFQLPFHLPLTAVYAYLQHFNLDLATVFERFGVEGKPVDLARLQLSFEQHALMTTPKTDEGELRKFYGVPRGVSSDDLRSYLKTVDTFLEHTGITRKQLQELIYQNLHNDEINNRHQFFINRGEDAPLQISECANVDRDRDRPECIDNLTFNTLDRIHRFIRLAHQLQWSFTDLDWALNALKATAAKIEDATVKQLTEIKWLRDRFDRPMDRLSSLWHDMKTYGIGSELTSEALFDRIYNLPFSFNRNPSNDPYRPKYGGNPHYSDPPIPWQPDNRSDENGQIRNRLLAALRIDNDDLSRLVQFIFAGDNGDLPDSIDLTVPNLSKLYRYNTFAALLELPIDAFLLLLDLIDRKQIDSVQHVVDITQWADWLRQASLTVYQLAYLTRQQVNAYVDRGYAVEDVKPMIQQWLEDSQIWVANELSFVTPNSIDEFVTSNKIDREGSKQIFQQLQETGLLNANGAIAREIEEPTRTQPIDPQVRSDLETLDLNDSQLQHVTTVLYQRRQQLLAIVMDRLAEFFSVSQDLVQATAAFADDATEQDRLALLLRPLAPDDPIEAHQNWIANLAHKLYTARTLDLSAEHMQGIFEQPESFELANSAPDNARRIRRFEGFHIKIFHQFKQLADDFRTIDNGLIGYFSLAPEADGDMPGNKLARLAAISGWDRTEIVGAVKHLNISAAALNSVRGIHSLSRVFELQQILGIGVDSLHHLAQLHGPGSDDTWDRYENGSAILLNALQSKYDKEQWESIFGPIQDTLNELKRNALVGYCGYRLGVKDPFKNLYEHFLMDVAMGGCAKISRLKQGLNSLQLYIHRCRAGLEPEVTSTITEAEWKEIGAYRLWEAHQKLRCYPENYVDPGLRKLETPIYAEIRQEILQGDLTEEAAEQAYRNYFEKFAEEANLQPIDACFAHVVNPETEELTRILFLVGRARNTPHTYYVRQAEVGIEENSPMMTHWLPWEPLQISAAIQAQTVTPVYGFKTWFLFWVEQSETIHTRMDNNQSIKTTGTLAKIQYIYKDARGEWTPPQVLAEEILIKVVSEESGEGSEDKIKQAFPDYQVWMKDTATPEPFWQKAYPILLPKQDARDEQIAILYGSFSKASENSYNMTLPASILNADLTVEKSECQCKGEGVFGRPWQKYDSQQIQHFFPNLPEDFLEFDACHGDSNPSSGELVFFKDKEALFYPTDGSIRRQDISSSHGPIVPMDCAVITTNVVYYFRKTRVSRNTSMGPVNIRTFFPEIPESFMPLDAVFRLPNPNNRNRICFIKGDEYLITYPLRFIDPERGKILDKWPLWPQSFIPVDSVVPKHFGSSELYLFKAGRCVRLDSDNRTLILPKLLRGQPRNTIIDNAFGFFQPSSNDLEILGNTRTCASSIPVKNVLGWSLFDNGDEAFVVSPQQQNLEELSSQLTVYDQAGKLILEYGGASVQPEKFKFTRLTTHTVTQLSSRLAAGGLSHLLHLDSQRLPELAFERMQPSTNAVPPETQQLDFSGPFGCYYWEIFFYIPFLLAKSLNEKERFEESRTWYTYIFNPYAGFDFDTSNLMHHWGFEGNAIDRITGAQSPVHNVTWPIVNDFPGKDSRRVIQFEGKTSEVLPGFILSPWSGGQPGRNLTIEFWYQAISPGTPRAILYEYNNLEGDPHAPRGLSIEISDYKLTVQFSWENAYKVQMPDVWPGDGQYHHCAFCYDIETHKMSLYFDGKFQTAEDLNHPYLTSGFPVRFWAEGGVGRMADVKIWQRVLTADEIFKLANPSDRVWQFLPLRNQRKQTVLNRLADPANLSAYARHRFDAEANARLNGASLQKALVMRYIDNLLAWGDDEFTQDTWENNLLATMLYMQASDILGPRPKQIAKLLSNPSCSNPSFSNNNGTGSGASGAVAMPRATETARLCRVKLEQYIQPGADSYRLSAQSCQPSNDGFFVPENEELVNYWNLIDDRLYKLRNCMNIEGVERQLAQFQPPIDPRQIVERLGGDRHLLNVPEPVSEPPQRFPVYIARAKSATQQVISLGQTLLRILESKDSADLAKTSRNHEKQLRLLETTTRNDQQKRIDIKQEEIHEQEQIIAALETSKDRIKIELSWLVPLVAGDSLSDVASIAALGAAAKFSVLEATTMAVAVPAHLVPTIFGFSNGGMVPGDSTEAVSKVAAIKARLASTAASILSSSATLVHRTIELAARGNLLKIDLDKIDKDIAVANIRLEILKQQQAIQKKQAEQWDEKNTLIEHQFTGSALYAWMLQRVASVYRQAFQIAFEWAQSAQKLYQDERTSTQRFLDRGHWDDVWRGLLAAEGLMVNLEQLEKAYLDSDGREQQLSKDISLKELNPWAFLALQRDGVCVFDLNERLFDLDFPGHYCRRIKSISISLQVASSRTYSLQATLKQLLNRIVKTPDVNAVQFLLGEPDVPQPDAATVVMDYRANQQIAICRCDRDCGLFELKFDGDRYLPFEGTGAVSRWELRMPKATNRLDYTQVSDVIVHLNYTALNGDEAFTNQLVKTEALRTYSGNHSISLRQDFPEQWDQLATTHRSQLQLHESRFQVNLKPETLQIGSTESGERKILVAMVFSALPEHLDTQAIELRLNDRVWDPNAGQVQVPARDLVDGYSVWHLDLKLENLPDRLTFADVADSKIEEGQLLDILMILPFEGELDWRGITASYEE